MRTSLTFGVLWALIGVMAPISLAQTDKTDKQPAVSPAAVVDSAALAKTRAAMHRTIADLIEARAADKPDQAKIKELTDRLQTLRGQSQARGPGGWQCPFGGSGLGYGPAWGGGRGPGAGPGRGFGPGYGRGAGWGPGLGAGRGGPMFVDENHDGVCDHYEALWGQK